MQRIIFQQDDGRVAIIIPTLEALANYSIEEIAQKDVPFGKPYKIIDESEIPSDRTFRDAWTIDESTLNDGVGAESNQFPEKQNGV